MDAQFLSWLQSLVEDSRFVNFTLTTQANDEVIASVAKIDITRKISTETGSGQTAEEAIANLLPDESPDDPLDEFESLLG